MRMVDHYVVHDGLTWTCLRNLLTDYQRWNLKRGSGGDARMETPVSRMGRVNWIKAGICDEMFYGPIISETITTKSIVLYSGGWRGTVVVWAYVI